MDARNTSPEAIPFLHPEEAMGGLPSELAARVVALASDAALVVDADGRIRDLAVSHPDLAAAGAEAWRGRPWIETVEPDSRNKVLEILSETPTGPPRWRQVNQLTDHGEIPMRWLVVPAGADGRLIALGRDLRADVGLQQRFLAAQQAVERERLRLRQAEARYRLLFGIAAEAMLIVDLRARLVVEANVAARTLLGRDDLVGRPVAQLVAVEDRDALLSFLGAVSVADQVPPIDLRAAGSGQALKVSGLHFREGRSSFALLRMAPAEGTSASRTSLDWLLEQVPDPFVLADPAGQVAEFNGAFLELTGYARAQELRGQPLARFVGRPGIDWALIERQLAEHGALRRFPTQVRTRFGQDVDVELSAVAAARDGEEGRWIGCTFRTPAEPAPGRRDLPSPRSVEELTRLVGRMSLKEIVRESTDLIERLCIEAALKCADNNRASAAEILGLSRQGLYLKLHRHGLARDPGEETSSDS
ncbi:MAG: transcriptional regulator PpsR [Sphingomonadaceae bacterium]|uniref:transcriptional regulator PpsR n=1 Tax=Thermaurantiacus sp. TaxID=2820283 RepID=UPI00298F2F3A|nr:transcriptional regulator PpsR [Thermaurantiacus sp.]MCS6987797.1 transcriptional regulator PpsR [Sphingomonadaceae bacterium]MDW8414983.1 transcriptional regulator PpsR [Thermaurantiacus sp.]